MSTQNLLSLLNNDDRFVRNGAKFQKCCSELSSTLSQTALVDKINSSITCLKNIVYFVNLLQYANKRKDSLAEIIYTSNQITTIIDLGPYAAIDYEALTESELKSILKDSYLDYKNIVLETDGYDEKAEFLKSLLNKPETKKPEIISKSVEGDEDFWVHAVRLDIPYIPQPDGLNVVCEKQYDSNNYCVYGEATLPWNQSQITALTDVNEFSDKDILSLFPPIRLYTRSQYMYQLQEGLEYDEDLGLIIKINGFSKKLVKENILKYPHIVHLDRQVTLKGENVTIPFWKHIEIDGEIIQTSSVWKEMEDTRDLPQTESFMNEYVVRKYLLERDSGVNHKYKMRGDLSEFITLYAPPAYYEDKGYDPIEVGRQCVRSRVLFKKSRNPILNHVEIEDNK